MSLGKFSKSVVLLGLAEHLNIFETWLLLDRDKAAFIKHMLDQGDLSFDEVRLAVHEGLLRCGYKMYEQHTRLGIHLDYLRSPQALGYALQHGHVTESEAKHICFDHHKTLEEYRAYADGLLEFIVEQIAMRPSEPYLCPVGQKDSGDECFECH